MIVHWMRVGFVHGVMNTDNMSILGLTIDYGPYGWLDNYDPDWTPNTTDAGDALPLRHPAAIAQWNLRGWPTPSVPLVGGRADARRLLRPDEVTGDVLAASPGGCALARPPRRRRAPRRGWTP
jgi:uncharacterized protein YdiU (UPF0061 family)